MTLGECDTDRKSKNDGGILIAKEAGRHRGYTRVDTHTQVRITTHECERRHTGNNVSHHILKCAAYEFKTPPGITSVTNRMSHITTGLSFTPPAPRSLPAAPASHIPPRKVCFQLHIFPLSFLPPRGPRGVLQTTLRTRPVQASQLECKHERDHECDHEHAHFSHPQK
jgi:hypothetical protein